MKAVAIAALLAALSPRAMAAERSWNFRVLLDGREIGTHRFELERSGDESILRSHARFRVSVLFVDVHVYEHRAEERWRGGCLASLAARTEVNGKVETVRARREDGRLVVERRDGVRRHEGCVMSFAYWNPAIFSARALLNAQTGELMPVSVTTGAPETRPADAEPGTRHRIAAPGLAIDVLYANEDWIALESTTPTGARLRYERS